jgi:hypothetical protein
LRAAWRVAQVRLRFVIVFALAFLIVGKWETLRAYWDRLTTFVGADAPQAISSDTEYFCPMCPGVISGWPSKCPVCNMALVRRKKGGAVQLPGGVVSRMQYSPYRLQLAGVRTSPANYMPLARQIVARALVESGKPGEPHIELQMSHQDAAMLGVDRTAVITAFALPARGPWTARVGSLQFDSPQRPLVAIVRLEIDDANGELSPGMEVSAQFSVPVAELEPFRSQPTGPEPLADGEPRRVFVCPDHSDVLGEQGGKCPRDGLELVEQPLADNERLRYWCPMHPEVTAREKGHKCDQCNGMILVPRVVAYRPPGEVLVVPETAVIDTGKRQLVYIDRGEGMFDGVEVAVGPSVDGFCAIAAGLQSGQKVASTGAFLLDAETRLNPNTSAAYFGATTNPRAASDSPAPAAADASAPPNDDAQRKEIEAALSQLTPEDERLARRQRVCPVTKLPLGSMGKPERLVVEGRVVFLCCAGCSPAILNDPAKYLPPAPVGQAFQPDTE